MELGDEQSTVVGQQRAELLGEFLTAQDPLRRERLRAEDLERRPGWGRGLLSGDQSRAAEGRGQQSEHLARPGWALPEPDAKIVQPRLQLFVDLLARERVMTGLQMPEKGLQP